ncbi:hypothetical protein SeMB42_g02514 [Synchytrium endobioticum]|uniref:Uncharacterized protein n=1 Tax=Synchytrium endobioticum TaxID=286115 RepID=A0A507D9K0_9FUNG|nr:hypothetical protein SeLEV6574_g02265 [Synchytrium endobioticum]TPX49720.1 hypothetical protein SeMB42_g02514 [Synchytrium endobioticum]
MATNTEQTNTIIAAAAENATNAAASNNHIPFGPGTVPKKGPLARFQQGKGKIRSPSDDLMSPATKKVEEKRNKYLLSKIQPKSLFPTADATNGGNKAQ